MADEPYRLEIVIPGLPRMANNSGRNSQWYIKAAEARKWRSTVCLIVGSKRPPAPLQKARLTLIRRSSSPPDSDGVVSGFKNIIDGLVDAGVLANDRYENIGMPHYDWQKARPGEGSLLVIVEANLDRTVQDPQQAGHENAPLSP